MHSEVEKMKTKVRELRVGAKCTRDEIAEFADQVGFVSWKECNTQTPLSVLGVAPDENNLFISMQAKGSHYIQFITKTSEKMLFQAMSDKNRDENYMRVK